MNIASAGKTATAALLTFLMGSAAAFAVDVGERQIVRAYVSGDLMQPYLTYPWVETEFAGEPDFVVDVFVGQAGAFLTGVERVGTADDKIVARAMLGRAFLLKRDPIRAQARLEAAMSEAAAAGWTDNRINGVLRDLARIASANGDAAKAADYLRRADICPAPCAEDALPLFQTEAEAALQVVFAALGTDLGVVRIDAAQGADMTAFAEATYGPQSREAMDAWSERAVAAKDARPWQALDYYQRALDIEIATGQPIETVLDTRRAIANLLLQAGEYDRLVSFTAGLADEALRSAEAKPEVLYLPSIAMDAARLRARGLWHLRDGDARAAYDVAIDTMLRFGDSDMARVLLQDLLDARYDEETVKVAGALLAAYPGDPDALYAEARVSARAGRYEEAATLVAGISTQDSVSLFQRAFYLDKAGKTTEAAALRAAIVSTPAGQDPGWGPWPDLAQLIDPRDAGAYEGAAEAARAYLDRANEMIAAGSYVDAQRLWQIAYTLALGGETQESFRLMKEAASIAARLSFAGANDTDGGSLQLLRRDKFRYLLFVDIAWAAAMGAAPDTMSVSSRY